LACGTKPKGAPVRTSSGEHVVSSIALTVSDEKQTDYVIEEITTLLRYRHELGSGVEDDFSVTSMEELASTLSETMSTLTILLGSIAAISLLVGGIGVMNIMLVSVLERTREIGIRKALGAKERDIWGQFLIEAILLTFAGGIIGVIAGWGVSAIIPNFLSTTTLVTADIVVLAVSVSVGIGVFFGFYPAWNASRLNPIDALRAE
jgi:putative ABC transport system permease protein